MMRKEKAIIFGAAGTGQKIYKQIKDSSDVICFLENNQDLWGKTVLGVEIIPPTEISKREYDRIYIGSMCGMEAITRQLVEMGISRSHITNELPLIQMRSRRLFLRRFSELVYDRNLQGAVSEAGVYKGDFAEEINRCFPDRKRYLFDTFEGFNQRDILDEQGESMIEAEYLKDTSEDLALKRMPYADNCIIRKGYFPDTVKGLEEKFVFVSLDMDLYRPTLEGLEYFYPRMCGGGYYSNPRLFF